MRDATLQEDAGVTSERCAGRHPGSERRPPEDLRQRDNSETAARHHRWQIADTEPSRTRAGFVLGKHRVRLLAYRTPKLVFRKLL